MVNLSGLRSQTPAAKRANTHKRQGGKISAGTLTFVVAAALVGGAVAWFLLQGRAVGEGSGTASASASAVVHLDGFTVNLADAQSTSFLRITMDLALERVPPPRERDKPLSGLPMGRIRDTILTVLTQSKADALLSAQGKAELKKQLLSELSRNLPELGVHDIYFTEFLVQR